MAANTQQDPWAVISQTPAPAATQTAAPQAAPAAPPEQDPWSVVSQSPAPGVNDRYHAPKSLSEEISDKGFLSGVGSWMRDDGSTIIKRKDGQTLESQDGGSNWKSYEAKEGDYQSKKGGPIVNLISAGQKPGTISHYNPIVPLPGEDFKDTMKRAVEAGKKITPEQLKEDEDQSLMEAPGTLATALALGATGPVVYGGAKGVSVLKQAIVGGDSQILGHPENLQTPEFKKAHPYWSGALEMAGGFSTPENAAMLIGAGKLGKLPGPAAKIAQRLVQGGFGLTMLSAAVKNAPELWDVMQGNGKYADMSEDDREWIAKNLAFHITTGAAMGAQAMEEGVTGKTTPATEFGEKADKFTARVAQNIAQTAGKATSATVSSIGSMLGRTQDFDTAVKRSSKITSKKMAAHLDKIANVREDLQSILNDNKDKIEDPKTFGDAINNHIQSNEADLQRQAGATKNSEEPVVPDITQRLINRLDKFFDDNKGLYGDESDVSDAKKRILEGVLQSRNGEHLLEPNLFEAENVRRRFSRQGQPQFATNAMPTTDAFKAGSLEAASELRKAIDESYDARGVQGVKEWRAKEANLIDVRDALHSAQDKADKMGEGGILGSMMKKIGIPSTVIAIALGHPIGAVAIGGAVLGDQIAQNLTNPNVNVARAIDIAGKTPNAQATVPTRTNSPIHVALASHFGEIIGKSTYNELEGRFMAELEAKAQRNVPLEANESKIVNMLNDAKAKDAIAQQKFRDDQKKKAPKVVNATIPEDYESVLHPEGATTMHPNMGVQEGLVHELAHIAELNARGLKTTDGIRSHMHPENQEKNAAMSVPIDWTEFKNEDGSMNRDKVRAKIGDIAAGYLSGGVANELWHGIPMSENKGMGADLDILKNKILKEIGGFSEAESSKIISQSVNDLRDTLSQPNVREILEQHAQVREPGLDSQHHFSQERVDQVLKDLKGATDANARPGNAPATAGKVRGGSKEAVSGGKEVGKGGAAEGVQQEGKATTPVKSEPAAGRAKPGAARGAEPGAGNGEPGEAVKGPADIESPKLGEAEDEEDKLTQGELQTPHKNKYPVQIIDREGNTHVEQIPAYSTQEAYKIARKKFPDSSAWNLESSKPSEPGAGPTEYKVPTGKRLSVGTKGTIERNPNRTEDHVETHELGHAMIGANEGMKSYGMLRHTHPELGTSSRAAMMWNIKDLKDPVTHRILPEKLPGVLRSGMGGIAADEAFNNYPREQNHNFNILRPGSDGNTAYRDVKREMPDASHEQIMGIINRAIDQAKEHLTKPEVSGIIKENLGKREPGLSRQYHYSPERLQQMHLEAQRRIDARQNDNGAVNGEGNTGRPAQDAGGAAAGQGRVPEGTRPEAGASVGLTPGEPENPKLSVPPERTTGNPEHDRIIKEGGGVPGGMLGHAEGDHVKMFHDPQSGTTLGLRGSEPVTADAVREKLAESRAAYAAPQVHAHDQNGGSTFSSEGKNLAGKDLYAVGSYPERTLQVDKLTPEVLAKFKSDNQDILSQPGHAVGTWKDPDTGKSVLDISKTHADREQAIAAGKAANQKAIYHLGGEGEIQTGGTGEPTTAPESPKLAAKEQEDHPTIAALKAKYGSSTNPADMVKGGASFLHPDGTVTNIGSTDHPAAISSVTGDKPQDVDRTGFINDTGSIRVRHRPSAKAGPEIVFSVPEKGVTEDQISMMRQAVGKMGRNGNLLIEAAHEGSEPSESVRSWPENKVKEFASPRDVEPMLREIGAHPEQLNPKLSTNKDFEKIHEDYLDRQDSVANDTVNEFNENMNKEGYRQKWDLVPAGRLKKIWNDYAKLGFVRDEKGIDQIADNVLENIHKIHVNNILTGHSEEHAGDFTERVTGERQDLDHFDKHDTFFDDEKGNWRISDYAAEPLARGAVDLMLAKTPEAKLQAIDHILNIAHQRSDLPGWFVEGGTKTLNELAGRPEDLNPKLSPKGSSVPLMEKPLKIEGTGERDKVNTLDVAKALNQFTQKKLGALELGKAEPAEMVERAKSLAEDEAKYQRAQANTGEAWYTTDMKTHDDVLRGLRPELADPAKLSLFKMSEAVLSSGQKPYGNFKAALKNWDHYNETGEFSPTNPDTGMSWGPRSKAGYGNAMEMINRLVKEHGEQGASDWLLAEHPVSELRDYNKSVSGKMTDNELGAMILGPKRGPFAQNLHGIESAFTADMWVSRTWNRWMGTMDTKPGPDGDVTTDAPRNLTERKLMEQSFSETADKLKMSTSALQAVLWFYEQGLYDVHGSKKESWSFASAAERVRDEQKAAAGEQEKFEFGANEPKTPEPEKEIENPPGMIHGLNFLKALGGNNAK